MRSGLSWYKLFPICACASMILGCATDPKVYLAAHRQEGTRQDFDISPQELKNVVVSLDGQPLTLTPTPGVGLYRVTPREGEGDSLNVDIPSYPFKEFSAKCIVDALPPKFSGVSRAGLKVICATDPSMLTHYEPLVLADIATKVAEARTSRPNAALPGLGLMPNSA